MNTVHEFLKPYVDALADDGLTVHVPSTTAIPGSKYVLVTQDDQPGCVSVNVPEFPSLRMPPNVYAMIRPSREYGSAVVVDFDGTPEDLAATLRPILASATVNTRFFPRNTRIPADRRIPEDAEIVERHEPAVETP